MPTRSKTMLYFAYGSNLNLEQMRRRCPRAVPLGKYFLQDARLVFRGVADCIYEPGSQCPGGIWRITPNCEEALDRYEGVRSGMYSKNWLPIPGGEPGETDVLYYSMNSDGIMPPSKTYLAGIVQGYKDFHLDLALLDAAVKHSWDKEDRTHVERQRLRRTGRPERAVSPSTSMSSRDWEAYHRERDRNSSSADFQPRRSGDLFDPAVAGWSFPDDYDALNSGVIRGRRRRR